MKTKSASAAAAPKGKSTVGKGNILPVGQNIALPSDKTALSSSQSTVNPVQKGATMSATLKFRKTDKSGSSSYAIPGLRSSVYFNKGMFAGDPPATLEVTLPEGFAFGDPDAKPVAGVAAMTPEQRSALMEAAAIAGPKFQTAGRAEFTDDFMFAPLIMGGRSEASGRRSLQLESFEKSIEGQVKIKACLFAVGDHVQACLQLIAHCNGHGILHQFGPVCFAELVQVLAGELQPGRERVTPNHRGAQRMLFHQDAGSVFSDGFIEFRDSRRVWPGGAHAHHKLIQKAEWLARSQSARRP